MTHAIDSVGDRVRRIEDQRTDHRITGQREARRIGRTMVDAGADHQATEQHDHRPVSQNLAFDQVLGWSSHGLVSRANR